jgi:hypothetical protein
MTLILLRRRNKKAENETSRLAKINLRTARAFIRAHLD